MLNVYDFNLLNESWLPRGGVERAEAVALMEVEGIERIAPIARGWFFDPAFYRAPVRRHGRRSRALSRLASRRLPEGALP